MKTKCPHCQFKFDTNESLTPPFKIGEKVKFIKKYFRDNNLNRKTFNYTGFVENFSLIRAGSHCDKIVGKSDGWIVTVKYRPYSKKDGCVTGKFWSYEIKKM